MCKAPTLRLKALNQHTHILYIDMENVIHFFFMPLSITSLVVSAAPEQAGIGHNTSL